MTRPSRRLLSAAPLLVVLATSGAAADDPPTCRKALDGTRAVLSSFEIHGGGQGPRSSFEAEAIPLWIKISYTLFVGLLVPVYWVKYGPGNFLWFSDIALLTAVPALWLESPSLASMMAVGVLLPELVWNVSYFSRLIAGVHITSLADYMFDEAKPLYLRGLSLFHVVLPVILLWMLSRLGYDPGAWLAQTLLTWVVLPATYVLTDPSANINWVFGPGTKPQTRMRPLLYLALLMVFFPLFIFWPTHRLLQLVF